MNRVHLATAQTIAAILAGERRWIEVDTIGDYTITDGKGFLVARVIHVENLGGHWIGSLDPFVKRATDTARTVRTAPDASLETQLRASLDAAKAAAEERALEAAVIARWTGDDDEAPA